MKVFVLTTITAPYRVNLFNELGKKCDLTVCFEQKRDLVERNDEWYKNKYSNFKFITLKKWDKSLKTIKWDVFKYLKETNPDIVLAYEYSTLTSLIMMSYCKVKKIPYLINCDGAIPSNSIIRTMIKKHYIKNAVAYFGNGESAKNYYLKYNGKIEKLIPYKFSNYFKKDILSNPVSLKEKERLRKELKLNGKKIFLSIGRFEYLKGFDLLFEVSKNLKEDEQFVIIGGGPLEEEFKKTIMTQNIKNICIVPYMDKEELIKYYDACDAFVFPTRRDIWGLVVVEAMSRGLPVISSNASMAGIELIINNENGFVFENDNLDELNASIKQIASMDEKKLYKFGQKSIDIIKDYNIETMAKDHYNALKKIYDKLK